MVVGGVPALVVVVRALGALHRRRSLVVAPVSGFHRPEPKLGVTIRFTASEWNRLRARAKAEDRSLNGLVTRIVRAELDAMEAREAAEE